ncbi:hypothetical protein [Cohnella terricola]|uniref:Uncharacterized protein n=1 Tax=Cohnella terricola TaxID=1289167 RepID=A0A559J8U1_9BACL|nr:hypothetical protein [Cohnella terricola]TVX96308.1 hypothetical protein FPZ45_21630 [Cohnella terricola]
MSRPQIDILEPWIPESSTIFLEELYDELSNNHILYGAELHVIARRLDKDEVLFQFQEDSNKYVQVHLTWKQDKESNPTWPRFIIFNSIEEWVNQVMLLDHKEYETD